MSSYQRYARLNFFVKGIAQSWQIVINYIKPQNANS